MIRKPEATAKAKELIRIIEQSYSDKLISTVLRLEVLAVQQDPQAADYFDGRLIVQRYSRYAHVPSDIKNDSKRHAHARQFQDVSPRYHHIARSTLMIIVLCTIYTSSKSWIVDLHAGLWTI